MASSSESVDYWRRFFRSADADIFEVMEQAILVAASDYREEFRSRRDRIVEKIFAALLPRCFGCDRVELQGAEGEEGRGSVRRVGEKESKLDSSNDAPEFSNRGASNYTYDEAEALTEEIEEEGQVVGEVLRIGEVLANQHDESDNVLFDSLRRLQLMELSVDVLKATEIGRAVNGLRKHKSKQIRHLVRTLIDGWKVLVDEWVSATACIADNSPDSLNPSVVDDEEGLPSPPLDEGALFAAQTTSMQLSGFFDGMDDDGNLRNNMESDKKRENGRRPSGNYGMIKKQHPARRSVFLEEKEEMRQETHQPIFVEESMRQEAQEPATSEERLFNSQNQSILSKQSKSVIAESGPGRPAKFTSERVACNNLKPRVQQDTAAPQRKPPMIPQDKSKYSEDASVRAKLEIAKRKLHEGYQQAENAKKQRTIQVMELHDIPKQAQNCNRQPFMKSRNNIRNWANGRH